MMTESKGEEQQLNAEEQAIIKTLEDENAKLLYRIKILERALASQKAQC